MTAADDRLERLTQRIRRLRERWAQAREAWVAGGARQDFGEFLAQRSDFAAEERDAIRALSKLPIVPDSSQATVISPSGGVPSSPAKDVPSAAGKFSMGSEIGRGGIGRVIEAADADFGRTVALKLLLKGASAEALERFRREARITGSLEHPNIVPVHEMGKLHGTEELFYCMKRVAGRDLGQVIRDGKWPLRRRIEALRDACRGVAYAHARGVIHRDLKPANIMLGEFGEVLVVDWGLAKEIGTPRPVGPGRAVEAEEKTAKFESTQITPSLTVDGHILGTPAYMSPEQALGRHEELDARSDVWSLGASLYELLTGHTPFEAPSPREVARLIVKEPLTPPSRFTPVPPELEATCARALSKPPGMRHADAAEFAGELEAWLEGTQERERREILAAEQLARAMAAIARFRTLNAGSAEAARAAKDAMAATQSHEPIERKRLLWELEDRAASLERASAEAFGDADEALATALSNAPALGEARRMRAEIHWERYLEAEAAGDARGMVLERRLVEQHHDGALAEALAGEGALSVTTRAYTCRCLLDGRAVTPRELSIRGVHPWSGRALDGTPNAPWMEGEARVPAELLARLRVHAASCQARPVEGARVWAWRFSESDRVLRPVTSKREGEPAPEALLDETFGDSPFRPQGGGWFLGRTPLARVRMPMGSWLLVIAVDGRVPVRRPVMIRRQDHARADVTLFEPAEIPPGFLPVAGGPFPSQGDADGYAQPEMRVLDVDDAFVARFPTTCRDYEAWLNRHAGTFHDGMTSRVPRHVMTYKPYWPILPDGTTRIPDAAWRAAHPDVVLPPIENVSIPWDPDWPLIGTSWIDGQEFALRRSIETGWLMHQPHDDLWEKAARGVDGRFFPWGRTMDAIFANVQGTWADRMHPAPVDTFPLDESPWGIRGLGGNASCRCLNSPAGRYPDWRLVRGGSWFKIAVMARSTHRNGAPADTINLGTGLRLAAVARLSPV